jgi:hypothetical protein
VLETLAGRIIDQMAPVDPQQRPAHSRHRCSEQLKPDIVQDCRKLDGLLNGQRSNVIKASIAQSLALYVNL